MPEALGAPDVAERAVQQNTFKRSSINLTICKQPQKSTMQKLEHEM
jgi:hypothetical protein